MTNSTASNDSTLVRFIDKFKKRFSREVDKETNVAKNEAAIGKKEITPIGRLLAQEEYTTLAENVLLYLDTQSLVRCASVCKQLNQIISNSSIIQLKLRYVYHQHPLPTFNDEYSTTKSELQNISSTERNIHNLSPESAISFPVDIGLWSMLYQNKLFTGFAGTSEFANSLVMKPPDHWTMYNLPSNNKDQDKDKPSMLEKAIYAPYDEDVTNRIVVPKYDLMAYITKTPTAELDLLNPHTDSIRISFYRLNPHDNDNSPSSTSTPTEWEPIPHPDAKHPYLDIGSFPQEEDYSVGMIATGSRDTLLFFVGRNNGPPYSWTGILDWRKGLFCGGISTPGRIFEIGYLDENTLISCSAEILAQEIPVGMIEKYFTAKPVNQPCFMLWNAIADNDNSLDPDMIRWRYNKIPKCDLLSAFVIPTSKSRRYTAVRKGAEECLFVMNYAEIKSRCTFIPNLDQCNDPSMNPVKSSHSHSKSRFVNDNDYYEEGGIIGINIIGEIWTNSNPTSLQEYVYVNIILDSKGILSVLKKGKQNQMEPECLHYHSWRKYSMIWYDYSYENRFFDISGWKSVSIEFGQTPLVAQIQLGKSKNKNTIIKKGKINIRDFHPKSIMKQTRLLNQVNTSSFHELPIGTINSLYQYHSEFEFEPEQDGNLPVHSTSSTGNDSLTSNQSLYHTLPELTGDESSVRIKPDSPSRYVVLSKDVNNDIPKHEKEHLSYTEISGEIEIDMELDDTNNGKEKPIQFFYWDGKRILIHQSGRIDLISF
ncbi:uncharacterized protein L201_004050 [Kwoniella dendrophila CBS 6074]|uniref:F-box domain-containing protein n=1 Tax=Kwoniella dendrophila CBS 6074 TaxID=1295534 RepID=A0AAX4JUQ8_9TREE